MSLTKRDKKPEFTNNMDFHQRRMKAIHFPLNATLNYSPIEIFYLLDSSFLGIAEVAPIYF